MLVYELAAKLLIYIAVGFFARRFRVIGDGFSQSLTKFVMTIPLPLMIINSFRIEFSPEELSRFPVLIGFAVLSMAVCFCVGEAARRIIGGGPGRAARFALMFTNFTFFGLAVVSELYGSMAVFYYVIFTLPIRLIFYSGAPLLLGERQTRQSLRQFFSAPVVGVLIGFFFYLSQLQLPVFLDDTMRSIGGMASPLGLMLCGAVLSDARLSGILKYPSSIVISLARLILMPAIILGVALLLRLDSMMTKTLIFYFAMPVASLLPPFVLRYNPGDDRGIAMSGYLVALSTVFAIFTIPLWAMALELFF